MRRHTFGQRLLAMLLCVAMLATYLPAIADRVSAAAGDGITTVADPQTLTRPAEIYGDNTLNAGKVTVGKSVHNGTVTVNGENISLSGDNNFLVTISQTAQVMGLASQSSVPVDVVFVLDTSGSMADNNRATAMVTAANSAISTLMAANDGNRVAVVAFSSENYGEGSSNGAAANVLSSLAHYDGDAATNHLRWVTSSGSTTGNNRDYIAGRDIVNQSVPARRDGRDGGTNIHAGIVAGAKLLTSATETTYTDPKTQETVNRMPFLVILSDGQATFSYDDSVWYDPTLSGYNAADEQGPGSGAYEGNGFIAAMAAAYYKGLITEHYFGDKADNNNRCHIYTMGVEIDVLSGNNKRLAQITLDPATYTTGSYAEANAASYWNYGNTANQNNKNSNYGWKTYWNNYLAGSDFNVRVNGNSFYTFTAASITASRQYVSSVAYNDEYYSASNVSQLQDVFDEMVSTIQAKAMSVPTKVSTGDHDFDGYVTFTDPIGEYMEVKDMKGVLAGGYFYKGASFAQKFAAYGTGSRDAEFDALLKEVLETRLEMTSSTVSADELIAAAKASGNQAYYRSASDYDNSIIWWGNGYAAANGDQHVQVVAAAESDTVDYIRDPNTVIPTGANLLCRSYFFYGEAGGANPNPEHKYLYFVIRVQRELTAPYRQTVVISAPASLLAMEKVMITETHDEQGNPVYTANVTEQTPARVVYEVGLWDSINAENVQSIVSEEYKNEAVNGAGTVNYDPATDTYSFFTNDWDRSQSVSSHHRAMAKATFDAAADNAFYTYQEDTLLVDANGDPITADPAGTDAYYVRQYYDWSGASQNSSPYTAVKKTKLIHVEIPENAQTIQKDGKWYIPKGVYTGATLQVNGDDTTKTSNDTGSSSIVNHPHRTGDVNNSHYTVYLGNNGLLQLKADPYIPQKTVSVNADNAITDDNGNAVKVGDILTYTVEVKNLLPYAADITVTDYIPQGTAFVPGSAGSGNAPTGHTKDASMLPDGNNVLTWVLEDVPTGETRYVSFQVEVTEAALRPSVVPNGITNTAKMQLANQYTVESSTTANYVYGKDVTDVNNNGIDNTHGYKVGDTLVYHIRLTNPTDAPADVTVTDPIPAGTTFLEADKGGTYDPDTGVVTWQFADMAAGASDVVTFQVRINATAKVAGAQNGIEPATGEIYLPNTATITVDNGASVTLTTNTTENWADVGDLRISKLVAQGGDQSKTFTMRLTESTGMLSGKYPATGGNESFVEFVDGKGTLTVTHGQTVTVQGIPAGVIITVEEDVSQLPGWTPTYNTQSVTVTKGAATEVSSVSVTNTYTLQPLTVTLKGQKRLEGTMPQTATFGFVAMPDSSNPVVGEPLTGEVTVKAAGTYEFTFSAKTITVPGVYKYTISEVSGGIQGVDYDDTQYVLVATVTDNGDGTMSAVATLDGASFGLDDAVSFTNTYTPEDVPLTLVAKKTLKVYNPATGEYANASANAGDYHFRITDKQTGAVLSSGSNGANGDIAFNTFYFSASMLDGVAANGAGEKTRTFTLEISELVSDLAKSPNMLYDLAAREVQAVLKLDANGELSVSVNGDSDGSVDLTGSVNFTNYLNPSDVTVMPTGSKSTDDAPAGVTFSFSVTNTESGNEAAAGVGAANGQITFSPMSFSQTGTYTYWIKEANAGNTTNGITYDASRYLMKVVVSRNSYNRLVADVTYWSSANDGSADVNDYTIPATAPSFHNKYEADGYINLTAAKQLSGRSLNDGEFAFKLTRSDNGGEIDGLAAANGTVTFSTMYYSAADIPAGETSAVIHYVMREVIPTNAALPGVTYDKSTHDVYVRITDNGDGTITAELVKPENGGYTPVGSNDTGVTFRNTYKAVNGDEIAFQVSKELTGRDLRAGEFEFLLYLGDRLVDVAANDAQGNVLFRQHIDAAAVPGTYELTVREAKGALGSVDYDDASYSIYVKIEDDNKGNIVAYLMSASGSKLAVDSDGVVDLTDTVIFRNTYKPTDALIQLQAEKALTGRDLVNKEFNFVVRKNSASGEIVAVGSNDAQGDILFSTFDITQADMADAATQPDGKKVKNFTYVVMEANNQRPGVEVDDSVFTITITVTDDGNGALTSQIHYPVIPVVFRNTYTPEPVEVPLVAFKSLSGKLLQSGEFSFTLSENGTVKQTKENDAAGVVTFDHLRFEKAGVYTYTVAEKSGSKAGMTYDKTKFTVKVTVTDDGNGKLAAATEYFVGEDPVDLIRFENTYVPTAIKVTLDGTKTILDPEGRPVSHSPAGFRFSVKDMTGTEVATATSDAGGNIHIEGLEFSAAGEYRFLISELATDKPGYTVDPTVWCVHITIGYNQTTGVLTQTGRFIHVAPENHEELAAQAADELEFVNIYDPADVAVQLKVKKVLEGRDLRDHEFYFYMEDKATGLHAAQSYNQANGDVLFDLTYSKAGTYAYEIREYVPALGDQPGGVTYSGERYDLTVVVTDDGSGKLTANVSGATVTGAGLVNLSNSVIFHNKYEAAAVKVTVQAVKHLEGKDLEENMFDFRLVNAADPNEVYTASNDANGLVAFENIQIDTAGKHIYNITEVKGTLGGVTYDERTYTAEIDVADNGAGQLVASRPVYKLEGNVADYALFQNTYTVSGSISADIPGSKVLTGKPMQAGEFTFQLFDAEGKLVGTAKNAVGGGFLFEDVTVSALGEHRFTVTEKNEGVEGMTYDDKVYTVVLTAGDNGIGGLKIDSVKTYLGEDETPIVFGNSYDPADISVILNVLKIVESTGKKTISPEGFRFRLTDKDGREVATATSDENGNAQFKLDFSEQDIGAVWQLTVSEVDTKVKGVTYSTESYQVEIAITQELTGALTASVKLDGAATEAVSVSFTNIYKPSSNPNTGDDFRMPTFIGMMILSSFGLAAVMICRKRSEEEETA